MCAIGNLPGKEWTKTDNQVRIVNATTPSFPGTESDSSTTDIFVERNHSFFSSFLKFSIPLIFAGALVKTLAKKTEPTPIPEELFAEAKIRAKKLGSLLEKDGKETTLKEYEAISTLISSTYWAFIRGSNERGAADALSEKGRISFHFGMSTGDKTAIENAAIYLQKASDHYSNLRAMKLDTDILIASTEAEIWLGKALWALRDYSTATQVFDTAVDLARKSLNLKMIAEATMARGQRLGLLLDRYKQRLALADLEIAQTYFRTVGDRTMVIDIQRSISALGEKSGCFLDNKFDETGLAKNELAKMLGVNPEMLNELLKREDPATLERMTDMGLNDYVIARMVKTAKEGNHLQVVRPDRSEEIKKGGK